MITARENEMYFSYKNFNVHVHATQCDKEHFFRPLSTSTELAKAYIQYINWHFQYSKYTVIVIPDEDISRSSNTPKSYYSIQFERN